VPHRNDLVADVTLPSSRQSSAVCATVLHQWLVGGVTRVGLEKLYQHCGLHQKVSTSEFVLPYRRKAAPYSVVAPGCGRRGFVARGYTVLHRPRQRFTPGSTGDNLATKIDSGSADGAAGADPFGVLQVLPKSSEKVTNGLGKRFSRGPRQPGKPARTGEQREATVTGRNCSVVGDINPHFVGSRW